MLVQLTCSGTAVGREAELQETSALEQAITKTPTNLRRIIDLQIGFHLRLAIGRRGRRPAHLKFFDSKSNFNTYASKLSLISRSYWSNRTGDQGKGSKQTSSELAGTISL